MLQLLPLAAEEVIVTVPPVQKLVDPFGVIIGMEGEGFTVTDVPLLTPVHPLGSLTVTV